MVSPADECVITTIMISRVRAALLFRLGGLSGKTFTVAPFNLLTLADRHWQGTKMKI